MESKLVSVVIPVYNPDKGMFRETLESVCKQTYPDLEIIIVDDGSDVGVKSLAEGMCDRRIRYNRLDKHTNANVARNTGIVQSRGAYIAMLDADDLWTEQHVADCVRMIEQTGADGLYGSLILQNVETGSKSVVKARGLMENETMADYLITTGCGAQTSTLFMTSRSARDILWDPELKRHQDYDFVIRFSRRYKWVSSGNPSVIFRFRMSTGKQDFASSVRFSRKYRKELSPQTYHSFHLQMLMLAGKAGAPDNVVAYFRNESVRYKGYVSLFQYLAICQPQSNVQLLKYKLCYLISVLIKG